jgi:hypothetical protein
MAFWLVQIPLIVAAQHSKVEKALEEMNDDEM